MTEADCSRTTLDKFQPPVVQRGYKQSTVQDVMEVIVVPRRSHLSNPRRQRCTASLIVFQLKFE
jgi:hypothetical protein